MAKAIARPAKAIIDDALKDNRSWEWLCFILVILLVVTGVITLVVGIIQEKEVIALTGGGVTGLFWPAMRYARAFRDSNIKVRLYELALAMAKTPEEAMAVLRESLGSRQSVEVMPPTKSITP